MSGQGFPRRCGPRVRLPRAGLPVPSRPEVAGCGGPWTHREDRAPPGGVGTWAVGRRSTLGLAATPWAAQPPAPSCGAPGTRPAPLTLCPPPTPGNLEMRVSKGCHLSSFDLGTFVLGGPGPVGPIPAGMTAAASWAGGTGRGRRARRGKDRRTERQELSWVLVSFQA